MKIGILALQGDFHEHQMCFNRLNYDTKLVKTINELNDCESLVIPGGESTTISKLLVTSQLEKEIILRVRQGMPIWGTCAGLILISSKVEEGKPKPLNLIDAHTSRNFYGRQIDSFVENINFMDSKKKFEAIFIRAPKIIKIGKNVEVLSQSEDNTPVAIQDKNILGTSFHPELTDDLRIHRHFADMTIK